MSDITQRMAETSLEAFANSEESRSRHRQAIIAQLRRCGPTGATNEELSKSLGIPNQSVPAVTLDLRREGLAVRTGERRRTERGHNAFVVALREFYPNLVDEDVDRGPNAPSEDSLVTDDDVQAFIQSAAPGTSLDEELDAAIRRGLLGVFANRRSKSEGRDAN